MKFCDKLKQIREDRGLTLEEFAKLLGTSKQVLSRYENDVNTPKITTVDHYAKVLHVPLAYLINDAIESYDDVIETSTSEVDEIQALLSQLSREQKQQVIQFATFLASQNK